MALAVPCRMTSVRSLVMLARTGRGHIRAEPPHSDPRPEQATVRLGVQAGAGRICTSTPGSQGP